MPKDLGVDPIDLRMSSDHMDMHQAELSAAHTDANEEIVAAQAGWVGSSALALQAKFAEWVEMTSAMTGEIDSHSVAFRAAAATYSNADDESAGHLDAQI